MEVLRFVRGLGPIVAIALLGAPGAARPPSLGSGAPPWQPPPCTPAEGAVPPPAGTAWFRLEPVLDRAGTLAGQRLTLGLVGATPRSVDLPPESFASGPVRGRVLVGDDDGSRSRLRVVDVARGCASDAGIERGRGPGRPARRRPAQPSSSTGSIARREPISASGGATWGPGARLASSRGSRPTRATAGRSRPSCAGPATGASRSAPAARSRAGRGSWRRAAPSPRPTAPDRCWGWRATRSSPRRCARASRARSWRSTS